VLLISLNVNYFLYGIPSNFQISVNYFSGRQTRDDRSQEEQGHYKQKFDFQTEKSVCHDRHIYFLA
jgi:hypothetical protein